MAARMLKRDLFGEVRYYSADDAQRRWQELGLTGACPEAFSERNVNGCKPQWRRLARKLADREAQVLTKLPLSDQLPQLLAWQDDVLLRSWINGQPMQQARPTNPRYFVEARHLLRTLHQHDVVHNDLAKEPNWLVMDDGRPALIDYQLAWYYHKRGAMFRMLRKEDIRHLLKHKRTYCEHELTQRERGILATPAVTSRAWMSTVKPVYLLVTRKLLKWSDREGAGDRIL